MRFLEEILYVSFFRGIGRGTINEGFVPWLQLYGKYCEAIFPDGIVSSSDSEDQGRRRPPSGTRQREIPALPEFPESPGNSPFVLAEEWFRQTEQRPEIFEIEEAKRKTRYILEWLDRHQEVRVCTVLDEDYPSQLNIMGAQRPPVLYLTGGKAPLEDGGQLPDPSRDTSFLSKPSLAVIGSRWPGEHALLNGLDFARDLVRRSGIPVVSGLARGCDRMGHLAAIQEKLPTIAIMPCGPDTIVPEINRDLAVQIAGGRGCLMTEYPPGIPPAEYRYVERDRVTAALSSAVVVIECGIQSGTMQTVRAARSFGRPVACWYPDGARQLEFEGNRYMIQQLGAFRLHDETSLDAFLKVVRQSEKNGTVSPEQLSLFRSGSFTK